MYLHEGTNCTVQLNKCCSWWWTNDGPKHVQPHNEKIDYSQECVHLIGLYTHGLGLLSEIFFLSSIQWNITMILNNSAHSSQQLLIFSLTNSFITEPTNLPPTQKAHHGTPPQPLWIILISFTNNHFNITPPIVHMLKEYFPIGEMCYLINCPLHFLQVFQFTYKTHATITAVMTICKIRQYWCTDLFWTSSSVINSIMSMNASSPKIALQSFLGTTPLLYKADLRLMMYRSQNPMVFNKYQHSFQ